MTVFNDIKLQATLSKPPNKKEPCSNRTINILIDNSVNPKQ